MTFIDIMDLVGIMVFAFSGTLMAHAKKMDGFGVIVLASVTAIGGGTIRDLLLDAPIFWLREPSYIYAILLGCIVAIIWLNRSKKIPDKTLELADAIGLALFVVMGTQKAFSYQVSDVTAIILGTMTGCFGGMLRDVLANEVPMIFKREMYATCCIVGGAVYVLLLKVDLTETIAPFVAFAIVLSLRLAGLKWKWTIHVFKYDQK
jgi:uncharacterized membrane protein YeiH